MIGYRSVLGSGGTDIGSGVILEGTSIGFSNAIFTNVSNVIISKDTTNCYYMFNNVSGIYNVTIHANVTNCSMMFRNLRSATNIYININPSQTAHNFRNMLYLKSNSFRTIIFCNNLSYLNKTSTASIVGKVITWSSITNGYRNATYNINLYNNYTGST